MKRFKNISLIRVIHREFSRLKHSKVLLFASLIAPLLSLFLIMWIFSAGVVHKLSVSVVDADNSALSRKLFQMIDATPIAKPTKVCDLNEAEALMKRGKSDAILVIPRNLERDVMKELSPEIALYINNSNVVKGGLLYSGLYKTLASLSATVKVGVSLKGGMNPHQAIAAAQPVKLDSHLLFNPFGNYSYFLTLGLLPLMLIILVFLVSVFALGIELKNGSAKELLQTANNSVLVALTGKMLPYTLIFFMHTMVMNLILFKLLGTPILGSITMVLFSEFLILITYQLLAILILKITSNMRLSLSLGSAYTMMALTFAGVTFPTMGMPLLAKIVASFFPYTFWIKIFLGQTIINLPLNTTIPYFFVLLLYIIVCMFSFSGMKRKMSDSKYWGRA